MKKVLAIAPYSYLPFYSGGQKFIAQFFEWLGHSVQLTVISVAENDIELAGSYKILPWLKPSFSRYIDRSLVKRLTALVKDQGLDTLIVEHPYLAWLAFAVKKQTGIRVIIHTHNIEYQRFRSTGKWWWPVLKKYEQRSFEKADSIFFITPEDKDFAINSWGISNEKCIELPFGIDIDRYPQDKEECKKMIRQKHGISENEKILLFNGLLNYKPNIEALRIILDKINPLLLAQSGFLYKIIICGKGLPPEFNDLGEYAVRNIIYAGFVDDIGLYLKATDIFLNPVQSGGGIKTKMVEAIAYGATTIATVSGAAGIAKNVCGDKLVVTPDDNWNEFARAIINTPAASETPQSYYEYYYWGNIIHKVIASLPDQATA